MGRGRAVNTVVVLTVVLLSSMYSAYLIDTDFGRLRVETVRIPDRGFTLSALIHIPTGADPQNLKPAVIVTHGISSTKEMVDGISLELARRGVVAMSLDLHGHGDSGGRLGDQDPTLGLDAAVDYVAALPYVDSGHIGVAGHSLGAGAARAVAMMGEIGAVAFIAGGIEGSHRQQGALTSSHPENLLIAVGSHDVLFELDELVVDLQPVFGVSEPVEPGVLYGDFARGDARRLVVKPTTHLLEPMDPGIVSEVVAWFVGAFDVQSPSDGPPTGQVYLWREALLLMGLAAICGLTLLVPRFVRSGSRRTSPEGRLKPRFLSDARVFLLWGLPGLVLFLPIMGVGTLIPFPSQLFGSSMAWWLLSTALVGLVLLRFSSHGRTLGVDYLRGVVVSVLSWDEVVLSTGLIGAMYLVSVLSEHFLSLNFRFFVPVLNTLAPAARVSAVPAYLPFFLAYYLVDGLYLFELRRSAGDGLRGLARVLGIKVIPYVAVVGGQSLGMFVLNVRLFPGLLGFILEFMWGVIPILMMAAICSWWLNRVTGGIGVGVVFNSLLTAWVAASIFPFGSF